MTGGEVMRERTYLPNCTLQQPCSTQKPPQMSINASINIHLLLMWCSRSPHFTNIPPSPSQLLKLSFLL